MKISPTILNSSSALGSGSVSQCALSGPEEAGEGWGWDPRRGGHTDLRGGSQGDLETPMGGVEFSRVIRPFR